MAAFDRIVVATAFAALVFLQPESGFAQASTLSKAVRTSDSMEACAIVSFAGPVGTKQARCIAVSDRQAAQHRLATYR